MSWMYATSWSHVGSSAKLCSEDNLVVFLRKSTVYADFLYDTFPSFRPPLEEGGEGIFLTSFSSNPFCPFFPPPLPLTEVKREREKRDPFLPSPLFVCRSIRKGLEGGGELGARRRGGGRSLGQVVRRGGGRDSLSLPLLSGPLLPSTLPTILRTFPDTSIPPSSFFSDGRREKGGDGRVRDRSSGVREGELKRVIYASSLHPFPPPNEATVK